MFYVSKIPIILSSYSFTQADFVTLVTNFTSVFVNILILKHDVLQVFTLLSCVGFTAVLNLLEQLSCAMLLWFAAL